MKPYLFLFSDDKYNLQNYPPIMNQTQQGQSFSLNQYKLVNHNSNKNLEKLQVDEPNNNSKNTSSSSSYDDTIDYDDSIQNHDLKETHMLKITSNSENIHFMKKFASRNNFEEHQPGYNGTLHSNMDDRKIIEDGNSSMNYASSDELNQNAASSDHGEKLGSGSEDEGNA